MGPTGIELQFAEPCDQTVISCPLYLRFSNLSWLTRL